MWIRTAIAAAALAVSLPASLSAQPAGETVAVKQSASAAGSGGARTLQFSDPVFMGDVVRTDSVGVAQFRFMDDTKLVVGPNSQVTIDRFVFNTPDTAREVTIDAIQGTFRFITGKSAKQAYTINTPVASIGVRGTELDLSVAGSNISMALYGGGVRMCDYSRPRLCVDLDDACGVIQFDPQRGYRWERDVYTKTRLMDTIFPYAFRQQLLNADFRVASGSCEYRNTAPGARPSGTSSGALPPPPPPPPPVDGGDGEGEID
jgi:FecR protein